MQVARRTFLVSTLASVAAPALLRSARGDAPVALKLHHSFSAVSGSHERFLVPWARKVEAESNGRLRIDLFPSMQLGGAPAQLYDQVRDGIADIVWTTPSSTPGRFSRIEACELPFVLSIRSLVNSRALDEFAAANAPDDFRDVHPLCFSCRDHGVLHANRAIRAIEDVKGLRLHVPNRLAGETARLLGAHGVTVPTPQLPMALAAHAIDACLDPWDVLPGLKLHDLLKNHTDFAGSPPSASAFMLVMNKAAYERLPGDLKTVINANSGPAAATMAGTMWDLEARAVVKLVQDRGDAVATIAADDVGQWRTTTAPVIATWQKQMKERKIDGVKLVTALTAAIAKFASEAEPQTSEQQQQQTPQQSSEQAPQQAPQKPQQQTPPNEQQKIVAEPQRAASPQAAPPQSTTPQSAPPNTVPPSAATGAPPKVAAPAPVAKPAPPRKELDIPL